MITRQKNNRAKWLLTLAALVLLMLNLSPGWGQVNHESEQPFIVWYHDWMSDYNFGEIRSCAFNSDESTISILSYSDAEGPNKTYLGYISFFDVNTGNIIDSIRIFNETMSYNIDYVNDSTVVVGADDKLRFYNINTKQMVRENAYIKNKYSGNDIFHKRMITNMSISADKRYLAASTMQELVVFDLLKDTVLMEVAIPDKEYKQSEVNKFGNIKFINKKKTLLATKSINLLEYDYLTGTLLNESNLGGLPEYGNFDISDSEDFATYASWYVESSNNAYIMDLETKKYEKIQVAGIDTNCSWSNFIFKDKFLQLDLTFDPSITRFYTLKENKYFDKNLPRFTKRNLRSKFSNKTIVYDSPTIALVDGDVFVSEVSNIDKSIEVLIHPNPGSNSITIEVDLKSIGFYKLILTNLNGERIKSIDYGYLGSGKNVLNLNIQDLLPGIYFMNLTNGKQNYYFKLVKE